MKTSTKALLTLACALLLVAASVMGTLAYLTSTDEVKNTFSVGKVAIKLDEAKVNGDGKPTKNNTEVTDPKDADRVKANSYKLLPGHTYTKDPTLTVLANSEESYIKMTVTITKASELEAIFGKDDSFVLTNIFVGYDSTKWTYKSCSRDTTANTRTYEFWYYQTVTPGTTDKALEPLFTQVKIPGTITNTQLDTIDGMTITANGYAIQADGFADAEAAWTAFSA